MRAKQPVSISGIEFDALIEEERTLEATVPEYAVESGFSVSDAILFNPETLSMTLFVTDSPVSWATIHQTERGRTERICKQLEELYFKSEPVTVITTDSSYTDMAITSISFRKTAEYGYSKEIPISFKKIRVTSLQTTSIPDYYGKSGGTTTSAGSANTSNGSTSGNNKNGSESERKKTILKSLFDSAGITQDGSGTANNNTGVIVT